MMAPAPAAATVAAPIAGIAGREWPVAFVRRHQLAAGVALMFLLTWPLDLASAAQSRHVLLPSLTRPREGR